MFAASLAPDRLIVPDPAVAVIVPASQLPVRPLGVATSRPAGRLSEKPTPLIVAGFGLTTVKVKVVLKPTATLGAPNTLLIVSEPRTVMLAVPGAPSPALDATGPVELFLTPILVPTTSML